MSRFAEPSIRPTTSGDETLPVTFTNYSLTHSDALNRHTKSVQDGAFRQKEGDTSPSTSCNRAPPSLRLPPDSLEDVIVEKWVDQPSNPVADDVALKDVFRNERSKGARFSPLGSWSKENRKTRSSTSNTVVLPYKREVPRNTLVHLRYRHYYPKSSRGADIQYRNPKSPTYTLPKQSSVVPHRRFFPHIHDERAAQLEYDPAFDDRGSLLEGYSPYCGERGASTYTTGGSKLQELDLEWTRERFAHASIRDDYDSDMTD